MDDWIALLDSQDFDRLVPDAFARYRRAILEGLAFFLSGLAEDRQLAIVAEQSGLPVEASAEQRLVALARHSPVLHKLGQVMARDKRLPAPFRRSLQSLEEMAPTIPHAVIQSEIEAELGPLGRLGITLGGEALAEASVAVVVPFDWPAAPAGFSRHGVFKLLKPGIEHRLREDLLRLEVTGRWLDERCRVYGLPEIAYGTTFGQVRELLGREVRLDLEQGNLARARRAYRDRGEVIIPAVYPFSTPRLTAMERVFGSKVTDVDDATSLSRRSLAERIGRALIAAPILARDREALFHADPHAGNLMVTADGRVAILDWSLVGVLTKDQRVALAQIVLGALTLDSRRIAHAINGISDRKPGVPALLPIVEQALQDLVRGGRSTLDWLISLLDRTVLEARLGYGADLLFFRKALHTVLTVINDISEHASPVQAIATAILVRFAWESGWRWVTPPGSRAFTTHVSTTDVASVVAAGPFAMLRWWRIANTN